MPPKDYKKIMEEKNKRIRNEEKLNESRIHKMRVIKDRKRVEMEYLDAVKRQMGYWKSQIDSTDPEDADRHTELKRNMESEKEHMKQVQKELTRINKEIEMQIKK